jgi:tRNA(fMet)-specific endonuclease VapC
VSGYLIDTDWSIQALAGREPAVGILRRLAGQRGNVSVITAGELYEVAFRSPHPDAYIQSLRRFLAPYRLLVVDEPVIVEFARLRSELRRRGDLIPDLDLMIAASALHHDLTLLTFNERHFRRVPDLRLYVVTD